MSLEIERKFLVKDRSFEALATAQSQISQGYLSREAERTVRVRLRDGKGFITIKSKNRGAVRGEWEYEIPERDARELLTLCEGRVISKTRYLVPWQGMTWEVDVFGGDLSGLILAEIELPSADAEFCAPPFVGEEVTGNQQYYNSNL